MGRNSFALVFLPVGFEHSAGHPGLQSILEFHTFYAKFAFVLLADVAVTKPGCVGKMLHREKMPG
jgi:hypothetical protein